MKARVKRIIFRALFLFFIFSCPAKCEEVSGRGLFVAMLREPTTLSSRAQIRMLIDFAKKARIKILFVQIYRANEAWFPSRVVDSAPYERCFKNIKEDPFSLVIKEAHLSGIQVHAWLNMLSLGENKDSVFLKKYGNGILTRNLKNKRNLNDYKIDDQYFLEPGDPRVRHELKDMVKEILAAYPGLDGIEFDYVRYPDKNPAYGYTKINIERFKKATGRKIVEEDSPAWKDWKRKQVTEVLEGLVKETRSLRPDIQVSATGCMPYSRAYYEAFQDWPYWLERGFVDFVTVMDYSPYPDEFERWILTAKSKVRDFKKVNIGLGAYKLIHSPETFKKEFRLCEKSGAGICVIFDYESLLENSALSIFLTGSEEGQRNIKYR